MRPLPVRTLLLMSCLSMCLTGYSQGVQLPTSGVMWSEFSGSGGFIGPPSYETLHFFPDGDTSIHGMIYTKILESRDSIESIDASSAVYRGAFRQQGDSVWFVRADQNDAFLWLDFSAEPGHVLWGGTPYCGGQDENCALQMVARDTIVLSDGIARKRLKFVGLDWVEGSTAFDTLYLIEGIGASRGFLDYVFKSMVEYWPVDPPPRHWLICFERSGDVLYQYVPNEVEGPACHLVTSTKILPQTKQMKLFPNPAGQHVRIAASGMEYPLRLGVYDLNGRLLEQRLLMERSESIALDGLPAGVYLLMARDDRSLYREILIVSR